MLPIKSIKAAPMVGIFLEFQNREHFLVVNCQAPTL